MPLSDHCPPHLAIHLWYTWFIVTIAANYLQSINVKTTCSDRLSLCDSECKRRKIRAPLKSEICPFRHAVSSFQFQLKLLLFWWWMQWFGFWFINLKLLDNLLHDDSTYDDSSQSDLISFFLSLMRHLWFDQMQLRKSYERHMFECVYDGVSV